MQIPKPHKCKTEKHHTDLTTGHRGKQTREHGIPTNNRNHYPTPRKPSLRKAGRGRGKGNRGRGRRYTTTPRSTQTTKPPPKKEDSEHKHKEQERRKKQKGRGSTRPGRGRGRGGRSRTQTQHKERKGTNQAEENNEWISQWEEWQDIPPKHANPPETQTSSDSLPSSSTPLGHYNCPK